MPKFFTVYDRPPSEGLSFFLPSKTEQAHKNDYDINRLIKRATHSGVLATADMIRSVYYGDFSEISDNFEAHLRIQRAQESFLKLPSDVRAYFENDPAKLLKALQDDSEGNVSKLVELGIIRPSVNLEQQTDQTAAAE